MTDGIYNQQEFADYLENASFRVEVHDRDRKSKSGITYYSDKNSNNNPNDKPQAKPTLPLAMSTTFAMDDAVASNSDVENFDSQLNLGMNYYYGFVDSTIRQFTTSCKHLPAWN